MRRIAFRLLILALSLSCLALTPAPIKPTTIKGKVTDLKTNKPISGVTIKLTSRSGKAYATTLTNAKGSYQISLRLSNRLGEICRLTASKQGYTSKAIQSFLRPAKSYTFNFKLKAITQTNHPPVITSLIPEDGSTFLAGASINIQILASDPDKDLLEYQISIGGSVKKPYSSQNSFLWQTSSADTGSINILCEARDSKGLTVSKIISLSIINPTAEEILNKVSQNYAKISDLKADMILSSTLNGEPFGETEYCRYYFKAPDKEKVESFADSTRTAKTEVIINSGSKMWLVDLINNLQQEVDLLVEAGANNIQFNQMNMFYSLADFISAHNLTLNKGKTDFLNKVICIEAVPVISSNLYAKLDFYIDYDKDIPVKTCIYREDAEKGLLTVIIYEVKEYITLRNGAYFARKMERKPTLESGELIETATYENIQVNPGLLDDEFDPSKLK